MGDAKLAADVAGSDPLVCQLNNPLPHNIRQRPSIYEHAAQLVHTSMACHKKSKSEQLNLTSTGRRGEVRLKLLADFFPG
jgi:hypothetical protein